MAMNLPSDGDEDLITAINTTPLVDVMLVLLIIFLITIPAVTASSLVNLPRETVQPDELKADSVVVTVDAAGNLLLNEQPAGTRGELLARLRALAALLVLAALVALHPYDVPEVVAWPAQRVADSYLAWALAACDVRGPI